MYTCSCTRTFLKAASATEHVRLTGHELLITPVAVLSKTHAHGVTMRVMQPIRVIAR